MRRTTPTSGGLAATLGLLAVAALVCACETPLDRTFGVSQRAYLARSIENPDAGVDDIEARRPDGVSTDAALTRYRLGETQQRDSEQESIINVDIGGS